MPVYRCITPPDSIAQDVRAVIAEDITRIHCELTSGTPRSFVHVIFEEVAPGRMFSGGTPSEKTLITGQIRAGRTAEVRTRLVQEISRAWNRATGQSEEDILVAVTEFRASDVVEGGIPLPEPGEEAGWLAAHGVGATT